MDHLSQSLSGGFCRIKRLAVFMFSPPLDLHSRIKFARAQSNWNLSNKEAIDLVSRVFLLSGSGQSLTIEFKLFFWYFSQFYRPSPLTVLLFHLHLTREKYESHLSHCSRFLADELFTFSLIFSWRFKTPVAKSAVDTRIKRLFRISQQV